MFYISDILDKSVRNEVGRRIGKIGDLIMVQEEGFPRIDGIVMVSRGKTFRVPWECVKHIDPQGVIVLGVKHDFENIGDMESNILLKRDILDKQIVDINGHRVVRVNDIQLNIVGKDLRIAGVDVGTQGLLRRMGFLEIADTLSEMLKLKTQSNIIPWDMIQTLGGEAGDAIKLSTPHSKLTTLHPADLADILEELSGKERKQLFEILDTETAAETLEQMEEDVQVTLFASLPDEKAADLLEEMSPDDAADLLQELPDERAEALLSLMEAQEAQEVKELLSYEEDTAGGIMSNEFVSVGKDATCAQTIDLIRKLAPETEMVYYVYIVEENNKLIGVISLRDLIVSDPSTLVGDIMQTTLISVPTNADIKKIVQLITKYDLLAVPVVDEKFCIKGIVTVDDVMDLILPD